jgi:hypothetical protein
MVTGAEKQEETRARQCIEKAKARHWPSVEQFSGTRLYVDDDYRWIIVRAVTVIGDQSKSLRLDPVPCSEVDAARAEALVVTAVEWVSEQHRA